MAKYEQGYKARLTVTIAPELYCKIQELSKGRRGGVSGVVEDCIRGYLDFVEKEPVPLVQNDAPTPEEVKRMMEELLSPENVLEAMKIVRSKPKMHEEYLNERIRKSAGKTKSEKAG